MPKIVDHPQRRAHYLDAFWRVVDRDGVSAATTRAVAAEAGLSKSNIGHYFTSRNDLLGAAVTQQLDAVAARLDRLDLDHCTRRTSITAILLGIPDTPARQRQSQVWLWLISRRAADPDLSAPLVAINARVRAAIDTLLQAMDANGLIGAGRDLDVEAGRLHALIDGISLQTLSDPAILPPTEIRRLVTAHVDELARPSGPPAGIEARDRGTARTRSRTKTSQHPTMTNRTGR